MKPHHEPVNSSRGAPMGRSDIYPGEPAKLRLERVVFYGGDYDKGGAYWGGGGGPLYVAFNDYGRIFVRSASRAAAKAQVLMELPSARFYR